MAGENLSGTKEIYNEGRVLGYSSYEMYVKHHISESPDTPPISEREWLTATLSAGTSIIVKIPETSGKGEEDYWYFDVKLPSDSALIAANTIIASYFDGDVAFECENDTNVPKCIASRVIDYGDLISNTSTSAPSGTISDPTQIPAKSDTAWTPEHYEQLANYLRLCDGVMLQPGEWVSTDEELAGEPEKDLHPTFADQPVARFRIKGNISSDVCVLLTGFTFKGMATGMIGVDGSTNTANPQNGDFLGLAVFPWANKIIISVPSSYVAQISSGAYRRGLIQGEFKTLTVPRGSMYTEFLVEQPSASLKSYVVPLSDFKSLGDVTISIRPAESDPPADNYTYWTYLSAGSVSETNIVYAETAGGSPYVPCVSREDSDINTLLSQFFYANPSTEVVTDGTTYYYGDPDNPSSQVYHGVDTTIKLIADNVGMDLCDFLEINLTGDVGYIAQNTAVTKLSGEQVTTTSRISVLDLLETCPRLREVLTASSFDVFSAVPQSATHFLICNAQSLQYFAVNVNGRAVWTPIDADESRTITSTDPLSDVVLSHYKTIKDTPVIDMQSCDLAGFYADTPWGQSRDALVDVANYVTLGQAGTDGEAVLTVYQKDEQLPPALYGTHVKGTTNNKLYPIDVVAPGTLKVFDTEAEAMRYQNIYPGVVGVTREQLNDVTLRMRCYEVALSRIFNKLLLSGPAANGYGSCRLISDEYARIQPGSIHLVYSGKGDGAGNIEVNIQDVVSATPGKGTLQYTFQGSIRNVGEIDYNTGMIKLMTSDFVGATGNRLYAKQFAYIPAVPTTVMSISDQDKYINWNEYGTSGICYNWTSGDHSDDDAILWQVLKLNIQTLLLKNSSTAVDIYYDDGEYITFNAGESFDDIIEYFYENRYSIYDALQLEDNEGINEIIHSASSAAMSIKLPHAVGGPISSYDTYNVGVEQFTLTDWVPTQYTVSERGIILNSLPSDTTVYSLFTSVVDYDEVEHNKFEVYMSYSEPQTDNIPVGAIGFGWKGTYTNVLGQLQDTYVHMLVQDYVNGAYVKRWTAQPSSSQPEYAYSAANVHFLSGLPTI